MTITEISRNVQALLVESGLFVDVIPAPQEGDTLIFTGYPSAFHYYEYDEGNTATVSQNRDSINYTVQIVMHSDETVTKVQEFAEAYELIDESKQMFTKSRDLTTLEYPRACDILRPVPGALSRVSTDLGDGLMATIRLTCEADVAFR